MMNIDNLKLFLGIDGGQSHTEAVIANVAGEILGTGLGGALDHGNLSGGREKLETAVRESVNNALQNAKLPNLDHTSFTSAHCGLSGGADYKEEIIRQIITAENLTVGNDALTALYAATGGKPGIVVIAGTGSIVFGINQKGKTARSGGLGFMFSDEGSGFWLAAEIIKLAIKEQDGVITNQGLRKLVLDFFNVGEIRELTNAFYNNQISRDRIAGFSKVIAEKAESGNRTLEDVIKRGAKCLVENVKGAADKLEFESGFAVCAVGGMFRGELLKRFFVKILRNKVPNAIFTEPEFPPPIGALLLAFQNSNVRINKQLLSNLKTTYDSKDSPR